MGVCSGDHSPVQVLKWVAWAGFCRALHLTMDFSVNPLILMLSSTRPVWQLTDCPLDSPGSVAGSPSSVCVQSERPG